MRLQFIRKYEAKTMNLMSKRKIFLKPGELCFGIPGTNISTVLGSCVAITLWHPVLSIGAMCHFVLPKRPQGEPRDHSFDGRYGDEAIQLLTLGVQLHETELSEYQVKVFGGADVCVRELDTAHRSIGQENVAQAMNLLSQRNMDVLVCHVGESGNRKIVLDLNTGDVWVKHTAQNGQVIPTTSGKI